jgi:hypothetical protein
MNFTLGCISLTIAFLLGDIAGVIVTANVMQRVTREENREYLEKLFDR